MTTRKLIYGIGSAGAIALIGASPMLFGNSLTETLNMPPFAAMLILGGTVAVLGTVLFSVRLMHELGIK